MLGRAQLEAQGFKDHLNRAANDREVKCWLKKRES